MRRILGVAALLALIPCSDAMACSLAQLTPKQRVQSSTLAVYVEVVSVRTLGKADTGATKWEATVRRVRTFKGHPRATFRVRSHTDSASCGLPKLKVRKRLGLLINGPRSPWEIGLYSPISLSDLRRGSS
jgi:hypothetical protein